MNHQTLYYRQGVESLERGAINHLWCWDGHTTLFIRWQMNTWGPEMMDMTTYSGRMQPWVKSPFFTEVDRQTTYVRLLRRDVERTVSKLLPPMSAKIATA